MEIKTNWTFGNFNVTAACDIPVTEPAHPLLLAMLESGFRRSLQRTPASAAEKVLAGYEKRPKGFERSSIPYSDANAATLIQAFGASVEVEKADEDAGTPAIRLDFRVTSVTEHVGSEQEVSRVRATALWEQLQDNDPMRRAIPGVLGEDGEERTLSDDEGIELCHRFLAKLNPPRKAKK